MVRLSINRAVRWDKSAQGPGRVRVTPQLIRVSDQSHVWATVYDAVLADVFGVQSSIATQVADSLDVALLAPQRAALAAKPTTNLEAYDFYLRGKAYDRRSVVRGEAQLAVQMYQRAVELDPTLALNAAGPADPRRMSARTRRLGGRLPWLAYLRAVPSRYPCNVNFIRIAV